MSGLFLRHKTALLQSVLVLLLASASFATGRLSALYHKKSLSIEENPTIQELLFSDLRQTQACATPRDSPPDALTAESAKPTPEPENPSSVTKPESATAGAFFASKLGKKYYPLDCAAGDSIKKENRIFFATEKDAQAKGYSRSTSCS